MSAVDLTDTPADRTEWLEWRRHGIGGSDVPRILGLTPEGWGTPADVWAEKLATQPPKELDTEPIRWGHRLESLIIDDWESKHGRTTFRSILAVDDQRPWRRCSIDAVTTDGATLIEAKNVSAWPWQDVPEYYVAQVTWCMGITGIHDANLHALFRGNTPVTYRVEWDQELFDAIANAVDKWWADHIVTRTHPAGAIEATDQIIGLASELADVSTQRLALEKREKAIKQDLACHLAGAPAAHIGGAPIVEMRSVERTTTDTDSIIAELAELQGTTPAIVREEHTKTTTTKPTASIIKRNLKGVTP